MKTSCIIDNHELLHTLVSLLLYNKYDTSVLFCITMSLYIIIACVTAKRRRQDKTLNTKYQYQQNANVMNP